MDIIDAIKIAHAIKLGEGIPTNLEVAKIVAVKPIESRYTTSAPTLNAFRKRFAKGRMSISEVERLSGYTDIPMELLCAGPSPDFTTDALWAVLKKKKNG